LKLILIAKLQGIGSVVSIPSWFISAQQMAKLCYHPYLQFETLACRKASKFVAQGKARLLRLFLSSSLPLHCLP
jgi:hypothetical protein